MRLLLIIGCLLFFMGLNAQHFKNEFQFEKAAVSHFNEAPFEWNHSTNWFVNLTYKRKFKSQFKIYASYGLYFFKYHTSIDDVEDDLINGTLMQREYHFYELGSSYEFNFLNILSIEPYLGAVYRDGHDSIFFNRFGGPNVFSEAWGANNLSDFGVLVGTQLKVKLLKRINIGAQADFTQYINKFTKKQLAISAFVGFEFGK